LFGGRKKKRPRSRGKKNHGTGKKRPVGENNYEPNGGKKRVCQKRKSVNKQKKGTGGKGRSGEPQVAPPNTREKRNIAHEPGKNGTQNSRNRGKKGKKLKKKNKNTMKENDGGNRTLKEARGEWKKKIKKGQTPSKQRRHPRPLKKKKPAKKSPKPRRTLPV